MIEFWQTQDWARCTGCGACAQRCSHKAITLFPNEEGFMYPVLDTEKCVNCGLCNRVCPMEHKPIGYCRNEAYAVQHRNEEILRSSSSGGAFRLLADDFIRSGGAVVGCMWRNDFHAVLTVAESDKELVYMQGSKYVSSSTETVYETIRTLLESGRRVLFTGAPCQCAGLRGYLGRDYGNLLIVDFLCDGMPSQMALDAYVQALENRVGSKITEIQFRNKEKKGWGKAFSYRWQTDTRIGYKINVGNTDPYIYGYSKGYLNRYSCYECPFRGRERMSDITICDYWGIEKFHPQFGKEKGVSAVLLNTEKGARKKNELSEQAVWKITTVEQIGVENAAALSRYTQHIPEVRKLIYQRIAQNGWEPVAKRFFRVEHLLLRKVWHALPVKLIRLIRR